VINLMDALRRSVKAERGGSSTRRGRPKASHSHKRHPAKHAPARRRKLKRAS
jgi:non-homologous end joining protein Ku